MFLRVKSKIMIQCFAFKLLIYGTMKKAIWMLHYNLMWWYRYRTVEDQMTNEKQLNLEEKGKMALVVNPEMDMPLKLFLAHLIYIMAVSSGSWYEGV